MSDVSKKGGTKEPSAQAEQKDIDSTRENV